MTQRSADLFSLVRSVPLPPELLRLRSHGALVRALLEELERVVPFANADEEVALGVQLAEELAGLGCRLLECAATMINPSEGAARPPQDFSALRVRRVEPTLDPGSPPASSSRLPARAQMRTVAPRPPSAISPHESRTT